MAENYFMGQDGFVWFIGCVESRNDPAELGRVQVRCLGYHTENKEDIPTADLPWAHVMHPTTDPSMQGMGTTPSFLVEGTWVVGFFRDAVEKQQPIIMGSLPGYNQDLANTTKGFNDPSGVYPSFSHAPSGHSIEESDINRLARNDATRQHGVISKKDAEYEAETNPSGRTTSVSQQGFTWEEPTSPYNALYPKNHVFESESGHIKEYDHTPGFERIHEYHASGTFHEVDSNGTKRTRIVGNNYEVVHGTNFVNIKGDVNLTIESNCKTYIKGDLHRSNVLSNTLVPSILIFFLGAQAHSEDIRASSTLTARVRLVGTSYPNLPDRLMSWMWAKQYHFRYSPYHLKGGVVRSNLKYWCEKSYLKNLQKIY